ncbi:MAG TPA: DUF2147 domain-containing protein [Nitrococcus sp.]|nr:DUF2147 domain-containing protein [Nitrococcus sp.]
MVRSTSSLLLILLLTSLQLRAASASTEEPLGVWIDHKASVAVRIVHCGSELCGRIVWLARPYQANGELKRDRHNPDPGKRQQPLCGLQVLQGFRQTAKRVWGDGLIYDPRKGETYHSSLTLIAPDELQVRAYVLFSLFGKTQTWRRTTLPAQDCPRQPLPQNPSG